MFGQKGIATSGVALLVVVATGNLRCGGSNDNSRPYPGLIVVARPLSVDFGSVRIGSTRSATVAVVNLSELPVEVTLGSTVSSSFQFALAKTQLSIREETNLMVRFTPWTRTEYLHRVAVEVRPDALIEPPVTRIDPVAVVQILGSGH